MVCEAGQSGGDKRGSERRLVPLRQLREAGRRSENSEKPGFARKAASGRAPTRRLGGVRMRAARRACSRLERCTRRLEHHGKRALGSSLHQSESIASDRAGNCVDGESFEG